MLRTGNDVNAIIPLTMASADSSVAPYPVTTTASAPVRSSPTTHGEKLTRAPPFFVAEKISPANGSRITATTTSPLGSFHTSERRGGVERRQLKLKGVEVCRD
jgi:hypothetical protein